MAGAGAAGKGGSGSTPSSGGKSGVGKAVASKMSLGDDSKKRLGTGRYVDEDPGLAERSADKAQRVGKGVRQAGQAADFTGKQMERTGKAVKKTGKAVEHAGKAVGAAGKATDAASKPVTQTGQKTAEAGANLSGTGLGAIAGVPMMIGGAGLAAAGLGGQGVGKGAQGGGKGIEASGKGTQKAGQGIEKSGTAVRKAGQTAKDAGGKVEERAADAKKGYGLSRNASEKVEGLGANVKQDAKRSLTRKGRRKTYDKYDPLMKAAKGADNEVGAGVAEGALRTGQFGARQGGRVGGALAGLAAALTSGPGATVIGAPAIALGGKIGARVADRAFRYSLTAIAIFVPLLFMLVFVGGSDDSSSIIPSPEPADIAYEQMGMDVTMEFVDSGDNTRVPWPILAAISQVATQHGTLDPYTGGPATGPLAPKNANQIGGYGPLMANPNIANSPGVDPFTFSDSAVAVAEVLFEEAEVLAEKIDDVYEPLMQHGMFNAEVVTGDPDFVNAEAVTDHPDSAKEREEWEKHVLFWRTVLEETDAIMMPNDGACMENIDSPEFSIPQKIDLTVRCAASRSETGLYVYDPFVLTSQSTVLQVAEYVGDILGLSALVETSLGRELFMEPALAIETLTQEAIGVAWVYNEWGQKEGCDNDRVEGGIFPLAPGDRIYEQDSETGEMVWTGKWEYERCDDSTNIRMFVDEVVSRESIPFDDRPGDLWEQFSYGWNGEHSESILGVRTSNGDAPENHNRFLNEGPSLPPLPGSACSEVLATWAWEVVAGEDVMWMSSMPSTFTFDNVQNKVAREENASLWMSALSASPNWNEAMSACGFVQESSGVVSPEGLLDPSLALWMAGELRKWDDWEGEGLLLEEEEKPDANWHDVVNDESPPDDISQAPAQAQSSSSAAPPSRQQFVRTLVRWAEESQEQPNAVEASWALTSSVNRLSNPPIVIEGMPTYVRPPNNTFADKVMQTALAYVGIGCGIQGTSAGPGMFGEGEGEGSEGALVAQLAFDRGLRGEDLVTAVAISHAESSWGRNVDNSRGGTDYMNLPCGGDTPCADHGFWQVNDYWHDFSTHPAFNEALHGPLKGCGRSNCSEFIYDPNVNADFMIMLRWRRIGNGENQWRDWAVYNSGAYKEQNRMENSRQLITETLGQAAFGPDPGIRYSAHIPGQIVGSDGSEVTEVGAIPPAGGAMCFSSGPVGMGGPPAKFSGGTGMAKDPTTSGQITTKLAHLLQQTIINYGDGSNPSSISDGVACYSYRAPGRPQGHTQGRACDITFGNHGRCPDADALARGWALANWYVEYADEFDVRNVIWAGQIWQNGSDQPHVWRTFGSNHYNTGLECTSANAVGGHHDHIHVEVRP